MNLSRLISLVCILLGACVAIYAQAEEEQNTFLLIGGIVLLMLGVYRISRNIPSKYDNQDEETQIKSEPEDDN